ncbi:VOC family protein [Sciscionella sediminilitoris]|uniref:VOC family protein n=1 Tax=Sciscionella sediminilitoris TaxID=1445613 RepID=UPI0004DEDDA1|nr:VOC family protein [Sciscionella sp. SE31]
MTTITIALPTTDRMRTAAFYRALGFETSGEPAEDGLPEPLRFALNEHTELMFAPTGGFGWVIGNEPVSTGEAKECVLGLALGSPAEVDEFVERARQAGAGVLIEPGTQPWGYAATITDPDGHALMATG